jgi:hypothetical protein
MLEGYAARISEKKANLGTIENSATPGKLWWKRFRCSSLEQQRRYDRIHKKSRYRYCCRIRDPTNTEVAWYGLDQATKQARNPDPWLQDRKSLVSTIMGNKLLPWGFTLATVVRPPTATHERATLVPVLGGIRRLPHGAGSCGSRPNGSSCIIVLPFLSLFTK